jgi:hypothetical protein
MDGREFSLKHLTPPDAVLCIEQLKIEGENLSQRLDDKREQINEATKQLCERLNNGETTGDWIRDLTIRSHGYDLEIEAKYREWSKKLEGKKGEYVLISYARRERGWRDENRFEDHLRLGVLDGEGLIYGGLGGFGTGAVITVPVYRYIEVHKTMLIESGDIKSLELKRENIFAQSFILSTSPLPDEYFLLGVKRYDDRRHISRPSHIAKDFVIGDEAVKEWLEKAHMSLLLTQAGKVLSRLELEPTDP